MFSVSAQTLEKAEALYVGHEYFNAKSALLKVDQASLTDLESALYYDLSGDLADIFNEGDKACAFFNIALTKYQKLNNLDKLYEVKLKIADNLGSSVANQDYVERYLSEYKQYASVKNDSAMLAKFYKVKGTMLVNTDIPQSIIFLKKSIEYNRNRDPVLASKVYGNLAVVHIVLLNRPDDGLLYLRKGLAVAEEHNNIEGICINYMNQASAYYTKKDYRKALQLLMVADKIKIRDFVKMTKSLIYKNIATNYDSLGDYKNARAAQIIEKQYNDSLSLEAQELTMLENQAKYRFKENEFIKADLKNTVKNKSIMNDIFLALLLGAAILSLFIYRNAIKNKKIEAQQRTIESQRHEKELKDQELHSIDLMLETQEKERHNIANELHDNLGSMLTTLKMNFENLKLRQQQGNKDLEPLYEKTNQLLDDAYSNVRTISHLKNLGVTGTQGLLIAVKKMAEKMSVLEKLRIQVFPFGLAQRLDNQLEVVLFRIIQELCANVIKHSKASEVGIYLTQYDEDRLNIMIEDNGMGFSPNERLTSDGIGLGSIEKKVEQMGGSFTIDSSPGNGTTIVIEIPT